MSIYSTPSFQTELDLCACKDRHKLLQTHRRIQRYIEQKKPVERECATFERSLKSSQSWVAKRRESIPNIEYPESLPVSERADDIKALLQDNQVIVVAGETGSGKTTQIPKICLALGIGARGFIGHTQPRRLAARSVATRIADELGQPLGTAVGYQVRFADKTTKSGFVKVMTDGILLSEIQRDRFLNQYECIIIDEAHERSLNIDFLLGFLKNLLPRRPDLKVIITSATIDVERFSAHFNDAPVIEVSGRTYPVDIDYIPSLETSSVTEAVVERVQEIMTVPPQSPNAPDILAFFSGEREIRETAVALRRAQLPGLTVLPLYARLAAADQDRVFQTGRGRRIVLATNVAETSLTVPGIGYVIDTGTARVSRYSVRSKIQRLPIEAISQASANQRAGRCGRIAPGTCYRLYSEEDFTGRPEFTAPEILRTNLAAVILQMQHLRLGDIGKFPFIEPPSHKQIRDGYQLLEELSLVDQNGAITALGRDISGLPVDPRLARMLWQAREEGCLNEILSLVSFLSVQDPRERPPDKQQKADEQHRQFADPESDFMTVLNLWVAYEEKRQELSQRALQKWCKEQFLSPARMREWRDIHRQLMLVIQEKHWSINEQPSSYKAIHRSLLSGLLTHVGVLQEGIEFIGPRNRQFRVFPGSFLAKKPPKWVFCGQLLDTSRLFAHTVAKLDPEWLLTLGRHLLQTDYFEPFYHHRRGEVMARKRYSLYGLVISDREKVSYKDVDPDVSREMFIRECLANWRYRGKADFYTHNAAVYERLQELEDRTRSRDVQIDEDTLYAFYHERIPPNVLKLRDFERWRKKEESANPECLFLDENQLVDSGTRQQLAGFPTDLEWQGLHFDLDYRFEPNHHADGVTLCVRIDTLHQVPEFLTEWLVPGLLDQKLVAMLKTLPKSLRRHLVPIPSCVDKMLPLLMPENRPLGEAIAEQLKRLKGIDVTTEDFSYSTLDDFYRMNFRLLDADGNTVAEDRDLGALKAAYRSEAAREVTRLKDKVNPYPDSKSWVFEDIAETVDIQRGGHQIRLWPGLMDKQDLVGFELYDDAVIAEYQHRQGVQRLLMLNCTDAAKYLRKELFRGQELKIFSLQAGTKEQLCEDLLSSLARDLLVDFEARVSMPRSTAVFHALLEDAKPRMVAMAMEREKICLSLAEQLAPLRSAVDALQAPKSAAVADIVAQLRQLIFEGFMSATPASSYRHLSRYLRGVNVRLEKLKGQLGRDQDQIVLYDQYAARLASWQIDLTPESQARVEAISRYRWMLEEFRISLFSQPLKTAQPVSEKRLQIVINEVEMHIRSLHLN